MEGVPFVGPSYELKRRKADVQRSVNLMPTRVESGTGKSQKFLSPYPGLVLFGPLPVDTTVYFTVTSRPYPPQIVDSVSSFGAALGGGMYSIHEEMDVGISLQSGSLRVLLKTALTPVEEVDASISLISGDLRVLLKTALTPVEEVDGGIALISGTLRVTLITYSNWPVGPETLDASIQLISGTLA